ncbi:hypothetical protein BaRGS_00037349 [Batillaria attramentaria]|uniref:Uncharacterized protein n=1 Tax=Batillaria attramentaria TaxID=370345 RepID=A0ABD0J9C2_9CAEN
MHVRPTGRSPNLCTLVCGRHAQLSHDRNTSRKFADQMRQKYTDMHTDYWRKSSPSAWIMIACSPDVAGSQCQLYDLHCKNAGRLASTQLRQC